MRCRWFTAQTPQGPSATLRPQLGHWAEFRLHLGLADGCVARTASFSPLRDCVLSTGPAGVTAVASVSISSQTTWRAEGRGWSCKQLQSELCPAQGAPYCPQGYICCDRPFPAPEGQLCVRLRCHHTFHVLRQHLSRLPGLHTVSIVQLYIFILLKGWTSLFKRAI